MEFVRFEWIRTNERLEAGIWLWHFFLFFFFFLSRDQEIPNSQSSFWKFQFNCLTTYFHYIPKKLSKRFEQTSRERGTNGPTIDLIDEIDVNLAVQLSWTAVLNWTVKPERGMHGVINKSTTAAVNVISRGAGPALL